MWSNIVRCKCRQRFPDFSKLPGSESGRESMREESESKGEDERGTKLLAMCRGRENKIGAPQTKNGFYLT